MSMPNVMFPEPPPGLDPVFDAQKHWDSRMASRASSEDDNTLWTVWTIDPLDTSETPYLVSAMDGVSVREAPSEWDEMVRDAAKANGAENVRVAKTTVDMQALIASFKPVEF